MLIINSYRVDVERLVRACTLVYSLFESPQRLVVFKDEEVLGALGDHVYARFHWKKIIYSYYLAPFVILNCVPLTKSAKRNWILLGIVKIFLKFIYNFILFFRQYFSHFQVYSLFIGKIYIMLTLFSYFSFESILNYYIIIE